MCIKKVLNFVFGLLIENEKLSIGRVLLITTYILAFCKWSAGLDLPSSMMGILVSLLGYVLGSKVVDSVKVIMDTMKNKNNVVDNAGGDEGNEEVVDGGERTPDIED